ncbi:MAG: DNA-binding transcriptional regulator CytR [Anaerolineae bacterium]
MAQKVTLRDVARHAGVSVTTVSNVVRGWPYIAEETRLKVERAIEELGYVPHPIATWLRRGYTQTIGFVVPDVTSPHFAALVETVEDIAREHGYSVLVLNTHEDELREAEAVRLLTNGLGDGILLVQTANALQNGSLLRDVTVPVVAIDRVHSTFDGPFCNVDNFAVTRLAMQHLYDLGHRRIAHLVGPASALSAQDRAESYRQFVRRAGLDYEYLSTNPSQWCSDEGYRAMHQLLDEPVRPTAVFVSNDRMAIGAIHAALERGLRVPEDISLVGVDDIELSRHITPPLTTVRQPLEEMARIGIEMLLKLIRGESLEQTHVSLAPSLIVRESTAPPR